MYAQQGATPGPLHLPPSQIRRCTRSVPDAQLSFCFRVYDRDNGGSIDRDELLQMFSSMLLSFQDGGGSNIKDASPA